MGASIVTKYYKGTDLYSDGEIENDIIEYLKRGTDSEQILSIDNRWPVMYHLSPIRQNIIRWYPFKPGASVLEVGAGMGALTGVLCDSCSSVTAVELSKRRCEAIALRHGHRDNLEVYVGNLSDIHFDRKFDYITLIGVLEYAGSFTDGNEPYISFLKTVKELLKPDGHLLIAIENRFGMKYWCGALEDHIGKPFVGINGYSDVSNVKTFSKTALTRMLTTVGFQNIDYYYPAPDYKFPSCIVADGNFKMYKKIWKQRSIYDKGSIFTVDESKVAQFLLENQLTDIFANSFFIDCSNDANNSTQVEYASFTNERKQEYRHYVTIDSQGVVTKRTWSDKGNKHLKKIHDNNTVLKNLGLKTIDEKILGNSIYSEYCNYELFDEYLFKLVEKRDIEGIKDALITYRNVLEKMPKDNVLIDLIPTNCFYHNGEIIIFDQEWNLQNVGVDFVIYRAVNYFYNEYPSASNYIGISDFYELSGFNTSELKNYKKIERDFLNSIVNDFVVNFYNNHAYNSWNNIDNIINRIKELEDENYHLKQYIEYLEDEKEKTIDYLLKKEKEIERKDEYINHLDNEVITLKKEIRNILEEKMELDKYAKKLEQDIHEKENEILSIINEKNEIASYAKEKENELDELKKYVKQKEIELIELNQYIQEIIKKTSH